MYRSSVSAASASIKGSSVVPGLPNITRMPSCFNNSSSAVFPGIIGMDIFSDGQQTLLIRYKARRHLSSAGVFGR
jgi:hypothetical protein